VNKISGEHLSVSRPLTIRTEGPDMDKALLGSDIADDIPIPDERYEGDQIAAGSEIPMDEAKGLLGKEGCEPPGDEEGRDGLV